MISRSLSSNQQSLVVHQVKRFLRKILRWYWRSSKIIAGLIVAAILGWLVPSWIQDMSKQNHITTPDVEPLVRVLFFIIPWPVTVTVLILIGVVTVVARQTEQDSDYHDLLDRSERIYHQVRSASANIGAQLDIDRETMIKRFDTEIYTERVDIVNAFETFLGQREKRIFLVIGPGGTGKSTFLQHRLGELSGVLPLHNKGVHRHVCVYVDCKSERVAEDHPLMDIVASQIGCNLRELEKILTKPGHQPLIIFIDAINENNAQEDITHYLTRFASTYLDGKYPIYLCVSVRQTYWDEHRRRYDASSEAVGWLDYVYRPGGKLAIGDNAASKATAAGILMQDFDDEEFEKAFDHYAKLYNVEGYIQDPRMRKICCNPLMLRMLCMALRNQNISKRIILRDLDIFDEYAKSTFEGTIKRIGMIGEKPIIHYETLPERAIRGPVLELALGMVERERSFLSDEEVLEILQRKVRDALTVGRPVKTVNDLYVHGTVLEAILTEGEGIVLETGWVNIPGKRGSSIIRFVHERYLEYSIGRGLVRRWRQQELDREGILRDFEKWMLTHDGLLTHGFANLRQGLGIAVLVAENLRGLQQGIHYDLLEKLAQDKNFAWNQLACQKILQLKLFNNPATSHTEKPLEEVERVLSIVNIMGGKNDFVLRWDIERVLRYIIDEHEGQAVLQQLENWCKQEASFSQRLFGSECLGYLFTQSSDDYRVNVIRVLKKVVDLSELDFWIRRSLMFSIRTMLDTLDDSTSVEPDTIRNKRDILALVEKLLHTGQNQWDRSAIISVRVARDALHNELEHWLKWDWGREEIWTCTNAVLALEQACRNGLCTEKLMQLLNSLWNAQEYSPHLNWALTEVLQQAIDCSRTPRFICEQATKLQKAIVNFSQGNLRDDERAIWVLPGAKPEEICNTPVALVYHPQYAHTDLHNHPESKERVEAIINFLDTFPALNHLDRRQMFRYVSPYHFHESTWESEIEDFLRLVHEEDWIHRVRDLSEQLKLAPETNLVVESDLEVRAGSYEGACLAVRGTLNAVDLVISNSDIKLAIALVRPPGHLAGNKICIFNNIAIAARYGQQRGKRRVLIVDCDAHHGKSTHDIFYKDDAVVYFSTHQADVHPGTGSFTERGDVPATGCTVNVPIPALSGDRVYEEVLNRILKPLLDGFEPNLILISMGLDAYYQDNFSQLEFSELSYLALAQQLFSYCQQHKGTAIIAALEGGYDLQGMGPCVLQFMKVFGEWTLPADNIPVERKGSSTLDHYLSMSDKNGATIKPTDSDKKWFEDIEELETSIRRQHWKK